MISSAVLNDEVPGSTKQLHWSLGAAVISSYRYRLQTSNQAASGDSMSNRPSHPFIAF